MAVVVKMERGAVWANRLRRLLGGLRRRELSHSLCVLGVASEGDDVRVGRLGRGLTGQLNSGFRRWGQILGTLF